MKDPVPIVVRRKVRTGHENDDRSRPARLTRGAAEAPPFFVADAAWKRRTGLEFRLDAPPGTKLPRPGPHRMALVLIAVVFALLLILALTLGPFMAGWPPPLRVLATVCVQVGLMSYVLTLCLTPHMARFIHPNSKTP